MLSILCYLCIVAILSMVYDRTRNSPSSSVVLDREILGEDEEYALKTIGEDSVYSFFLSKSWFAWATAVAVMAIQAWILSLFVSGAEMDFGEDNSDYIYSWRCPRNSERCENTADQNLAGWIIFGILMVAHLMVDLVNGTKLFLLCARRSHSYHTMIRFFFGGLCLVLITSYTVYASTVYSLAIARSNTDIVVNSVIILFITDMDELFYSVFSATFPGWIKQLKQRQCGHTVLGDCDRVSSQLEYDQLVSSYKEKRITIEEFSTRLRELDGTSMSFEPPSSQPKITKYFCRRSAHDHRL